MNMTMILDRGIFLQSVAIFSMRASNNGWATGLDDFFKFPSTSLTTCTEFKIGVFGNFKADTGVVCEDVGVIGVLEGVFTSTGGGAQGSDMYMCTTF